MKKRWQEKLKDEPFFPKLRGLEKWFPCYNTVHKIGIVWQLVSYSKTLSYLCKR
jgi:hypothetical protein